MEPGLLPVFVDWTIAFQQAGMVLNIPSLMLWYGSKDARFSPVSSRIRGVGGREGGGGLLAPGLVASLHRCPVF